MSKILVSGGLVPTTKDTLLDARTRVTTFSDIANIENPARFMVITVEDTGKKYEVKKLSSKIIGGIVVENSTIDINDPEALVDLGLAEELRSEEEKVRQSNEKKRIEAENLRKSAEDSRNVNETNRVSAEGVREASERTRVRSEETRNANEQTRNSNETKRQLQESTRQSQESARQNNESTRNTNESARKEAESERKTKETSRRTAELSRSSAENERVKNEQNRTTAENTRSSAEDRRVVNETQRTTNETARSNAELSREQAEGNRASTFNTLKGQMQTTIQEGQTAVAATEKATSDAQKVVDEYDTKVAEQDSKLTELGLKTIGNISEYSVVSGVKYDWTFAVDIDIKEGEEFTILLETDAISTTAPNYIGCTEQGKTNKVVYDKFFVYTNKEKTFVATKNTSRLYIPYTATAVKDGFIKLKVSKGGTLADKIDKCNEDINELTEEIENVRNNIGYIGKSATAEYSVVAETKYDWTFAVDIDINIGEEFKVLFESDVYNGPLYIGYTEQGNTNITVYDNLFVIPNEEKIFVATKNTSRLYIPYSLTPKKDGTIKLYVSVGETLYDKINEIENNVNDLSGDIKEIEGNISSLVPTVYTKEYQVEVGGTYDWKLAVDVDIDEGEEFSILVNTSTTPNPLYFGYTEKGTTSKAAYNNEYVLPNIEKKFISTKNIQTLYIPYTLSPREDGVFSITVKKGSSILDEIDNKVKEEVKKSNLHPMNGKTFYSIGDSHRWKWLNKLSELTGGISGGDIFSAALTAYEKYYVSRTVAMAKYIVDLYKSGKPVDYIFMEYVHKYFVNDMEPANWYHYSGDITEAEPFLTQAYYDYTQDTFNNTSEAESFWNVNFATIVGGFTPKSNAIIALKTGVKVQSPKFKLSGSVTTSGNFTIKFTDSSGELHQMSIAIPSGLSINEALTIVNEIEFSDSGSKWDNLSAHNTITDATIKFTYNGNLNDADASIKMGFDFGTTGIVYDGDWTINTETKDWTRGFKSHDVSKWSDKTKWNNLYANVDAYIWIKAAVELLQREIPQAKIFVWTLNTEAWDYNTNTIEGKSVLYPDGMLNVQAIYNSERHKRMVQNLEGWGKVAKYYHLGFIPISEMNNISPANHKYYYPSDDVHPTQEGYDRVAEILARNIY